MRYFIFVTFFETNIFVEWGHGPPYCLQGRGGAYVCSEITIRQRGEYSPQK